MRHCCGSFENPKAITTELPPAVDIAGPEFKAHVRTTDLSVESTVRRLQAKSKSVQSISYKPCTIGIRHCYSFASIRKGSIYQRDCVPLNTGVHPAKNGMRLPVRSLLAEILEFRFAHLPPCISELDNLVTRFPKAPEPDRNTLKVAVQFYMGDEDVVRHVLPVHSLSDFFVLVSIYTICVARVIVGSCLLCHPKEARGQRYRQITRAQTGVIEMLTLDSNHDLVKHGHRHKKRMQAMNAKGLQENMSQYRETSHSMSCHQQFQSDKMNPNVRKLLNSCVVGILSPEDTVPAVTMDQSGSRIDERITNPILSHAPFKVTSDCNLNSVGSGPSISLRERCLLAASRRRVLEARLASALANADKGERGTLIEEIRADLFALVDELLGDTELKRLKSQVVLTSFLTGGFDCYLRCPFYRFVEIRSCGCGPNRAHLPLFSPYNAKAHRPRIDHNEKPGFNLLTDQNNAIFSYESQIFTKNRRNEMCRNSLQNVYHSSIGKSRLRRFCYWTDETCVKNFGTKAGDQFQGTFEGTLGPVIISWLSVHSPRSFVPCSKIVKNVQPASYTDRYRQACVDPVVERNPIMDFTGRENLLTARPGQPGSISTLVFPSGSMTVRRRKVLQLNDYRGLHLSAHDHLHHTSCGFFRCDHERHDDIHQMLSLCYNGFRAGFFEWCHSLEKAATTIDFLREDFSSE
ncbi:hypothetical protein CLF_110191 [Clonorchis sinensis]|uniref:Uncharacterized protein n=1 Tax=Clonorchis sinensis TaxID=79923 RepID=G7YKE3_CLOSI|nr:hypothetical protein CLF_110191 [Clonorchis sinensis]